ncbi:MAG: hypothetical protein U0105_27920 [Candidatus Obscuribacterales bacterium]|mgnify:CR=1 FL=1
MRTLPESSPTNIATSLAPAFLERMRSSVRLIMEPDELARRFGGQRQGQPLHTVYGGADIFKSGSAAKLSQLALSCLSTYAGDWATFCRALKLPGHERLPDQIDDRRRMLAGFDPQHAAPDLRLAYTLYERVCQRLSSGNSVVDMRVDFEDGFGYRAADVEDHFAQKAALEMAKGLQSGQLPPFIGIRIKPLTIESADRSLRTLDIFITTLAQATGGRLPDNFVVTLPKVTDPGQVHVLLDVLERLESQTGLPRRSIPIEIMVETPRAILSSDGKVALFSLAGASGLLRGMHFGTYDHTAALGVVGTHQSMQHPACDFARQMMLHAFAGTSIWLSDGATTKMPIGRHKPDGTTFTTTQLAQNQKDVHEAWSVCFADVLQSLTLGLYQGWDLHPGQIVTRYAANYYFFLAGFDHAARRLSEFVSKAAQASLVGNSFDDAATGQGWLNFMLRAVDCGAVTEDAVRSATGLSLSEIRSRSFVSIIAGRQQVA